MSPTPKPGPKRKPIQCGTCNGNGEVTVGRDERGRPVTSQCNNCNGTGEI